MILLNLCLEKEFFTPHTVNNYIDNHIIIFKIKNKLNIIKILFYWFIKRIFSTFCGVKISPPLCLKNKLNKKNWSWSWV